MVLRVHPTRVNRVGAVPPHPDEVAPEIFAHASPVGNVLQAAQQAIVRPLNLLEQWIRFREVRGELSIPVAHVCFSAPAAEAWVDQMCAEDHAAYVQGVNVGAKVKFCLRFFLPGKDIRPEVGEPLPTPEDAPEDETEQWEKVILSGLELRYSVVCGPPLEAALVLKHAAATDDAGPYLASVSTMDTSQTAWASVALAAVPFWRALEDYEAELRRTPSIWNVIQIVAVRTDSLRAVQRQDKYVPPRYCGLGHPLRQSHLYSTAGLRRPGLDAVAAVKAGEGCEEFGGIGRLTAYSDIAGAAIGQPSLPPVMLQRGHTKCDASLNREVKEIRFSSKSLLDVSVLSADSALLPQPALPTFTPTAPRTVLAKTGSSGQLSAFHPRLDVTPSPSPPPSRGISTQDPVRVPGDRTVLIVLCFRLQFGPHYLESEPLVVEPETKAKKAVVEEDPALQWITNAGLVCVSRPRLKKELAEALELPATEVVVGEIHADGKVDVALLDSEVAAALFGAKHKDALDALGPKWKRSGDLPAALERLRPKLADPNSHVHNPPLNSIGQLRLCLPARQARKDTL